MKYDWRTRELEVGQAILKKTVGFVNKKLDLRSSKQFFDETSWVKPNIIIIIKDNVKSSQKHENLNIYIYIYIYIILATTTKTTVWTPLLIRRGWFQTGEGYVVLIYCLSSDTSVHLCSLTALKLHVKKYYHIRRN